MPLGMRAPLANNRQAQYTLLRQRAFLQQVVHQTTHSLARFFLEVDANYKQFKTASRLRAAAAQRLDAQRAFYEEGRITIDRYLDAVSQYANAVAQEAQFKTTYNISIVALEEAKGTLLAYDNIAVAEGPQPAQGVHPGPRPAGRPRPAADPARRHRTTRCRSTARPMPDPVVPMPPPDSEPRRPAPAADAGPGRPARPAADAAAAAGPRRRAATDPLADDARRSRRARRSVPASAHRRAPPGPAAAAGPAPVARSRWTCPALPPP